MKCVASFHESQSKTAVTQGRGAISRSEVGNYGTTTRMLSIDNAPPMSRAIPYSREMSSPPPPPFITSERTTITRSRFTSDLLIDDSKSFETVSRPKPKKSSDTSRITVNSVANLNEFPPLDLLETYPVVNVYRRRVETGGGAWIPEFWDFDMYVFYTPFRNSAPCRPVIIYLHPSQVFKVRRCIGYFVSVLSFSFLFA